MDALSIQCDRATCGVLDDAEADLFEQLTSLL
jgi:hypothetical protein